MRDNLASTKTDDGIVTTPLIQTILTTTDDNILDGHWITAKTSAFNNVDELLLTPKQKISRLCQTGCQFGSKVQNLNQKMLPFIFTEFNGSGGAYHLLDAVQIYKKLEIACNKVYSMIVDESANVLFICTNSKSASLIEELAKMSDSAYLTNRWCGGTLTNWKVTQGRINALRILEQEDFSKFSKKEASEVKKKLSDLNNRFGGVKNLQKHPDLVIIIDQVADKTAIQEARKLQIPIIGIIDSSGDPELVDYPIIGNKSGLLALKTLVGALADTIITANRHLKEKFQS